MTEFAGIGEMLKFLRRRARLTQRELGLAVGYTESHISRLEQNQRAPDVATISALFIPALGLDREPVLAAQLMSLAGRKSNSGAPRSIPAPPPHGVHRDAVLDEVRQRLADERRVTICGLPGMGKTTVAAMLARELGGGMPVCWMTVTEGVTASADALVRHLARFLRERGHAEGRRLLERRDELLPVDEQLGLLGAALSRGPVLVCLDNAHLLRADPMAIAVLGHLIATTSAAMVLTAREEIGLPGAGSVRLNGLTHPEARALIAATGAGIPVDLADRLIGRTGGSPMLLRLALGQLRGPHGDAVMLVERLESEPQVTSYLLDTTLAGLSADAWQVLSLLAVFRRPVDLHDERLIQLGEESEQPKDLAAALDELQRRLLVDHPALATLHPLVHDHVYARMVGDLERRRRLHRVAAAWSGEVRGDILESAYHFAQAGDLVRAADLLIGHAEDLAAGGQALAAAELIETVLDRRRFSVARDTVERDLLILRGDLLAETVRAAEAEAVYREVLTEFDNATCPLVSWRLARLLGSQGRAAEVIELCEQAGDPGDDRLRAQLAVTLSQALTALARHEEAIVAANRALELPGEPEVRAKAHATIGEILRLRGQFDAAAAHLGHAVDAAVEAGRPELLTRARSGLAGVHFDQGDRATAQTLFLEALHACERAGDGYGAARIRQALTYIDPAVG